MPYNFSYVIPDKLAGSAEPGGFFKSLREELDELHKEGFTAIVTLTEFVLPEDIVSEYPFTVLHLPIEDFQAPSIEQIEKFVAFVDEQLAREGGRVLVHCWAGRGRTGALLACYFVSEGLTAAEAIDLVRQLRPGSIESGAQIQAIRNYEHWLREHNRFGTQKRLKKKRRQRRTPPTGGGG
ncbi:MAG: hypothetical protein Kow0059_03310 [Candidatus Sumerlaeia bacterium]